MHGTAACKLGHRPAAAVSVYCTMHSSIVQWLIANINTRTKISVGDRIHKIQSGQIIFLIFRRTTKNFVTPRSCWSRNWNTSWKASCRNYCTVKIARKPTACFHGSVPIPTATAAKFFVVRLNIRKIVWLQHLPLSIFSIFWIRSPTEIFVHVLSHINNHTFEDSA